MAHSEAIALTRFAVSFFLALAAAKNAAFFAADSPPFQLGDFFGGITTEELLKLLRCLEVSVFGLCFKFVQRLKVTFDRFIQVKHVAIVIAVYDLVQELTE